ncbi:MAG: hypothetical protein U1A28_00260 [Patescibacteria group bacterium]|nr:hypothetical protein [Patescibacteria group bacterium]
MDYCKILGTQSSASNDEVDQAYSELRTRYYLDERIAGDVPARRAAAERTQELNQT